MIWLGERRGHLTDWTTQLWVAATGRTTSLDENPWLAGPVGGTRRIGGDCFREIAAREGLSVQDGPSSRGIVPDFGLLEGPRFHAAAVASGFVTSTSTPGPTCSMPGQSGAARSGRSAGC